jgi:hypothetical protein
MSHVSVLALEMVLESFHEHRTRYRASLVIFTHLRIFPPHLQPTHFPINTFSFVVQSTAFCTIVTSLNCLVTDKVSHNSKCSTCSTPQYKNLQKNSKFQKNFKKKIFKNPSKKPSAWVPTRLMALLFQPFQVYFSPPMQFQRLPHFM